MGNVFLLLKQFVCLPCCPVLLFSFCNVTWKSDVIVWHQTKMNKTVTWKWNLKAHLLGYFSLLDVKNSKLGRNLPLVTAKRSYSLCSLILYMYIYLRSKFKTLLLACIFVLSPIDLTINNHPVNSKIINIHNHYNVRVLQWLNTRFWNRTLSFTFLIFIIILFVCFEKQWNQVI